MKREEEDMLNQINHFYIQKWTDEEIDVKFEFERPLEV
jgi:hypothetical protein